MLIEGKVIPRSRLTVVALFTAIIAAGALLGCRDSQTVRSDTARATDASATATTARAASPPQLLILDGQRSYSDDLKSVTFTLHVGNVSKEVIGGIRARSLFHFGGRTVLDAQSPVTDLAPEATVTLRYTGHVLGKLFEAEPTREDVFGPDGGVGLTEDERRKAAAALLRWIHQVEVTNGKIIDLMEESLAFVDGQGREIPFTTSKEMLRSDQQALVERWRGGSVAEQGDAQRASIIAVAPRPAREAQAVETTNGRRALHREHQPVVSSDESSSGTRPTATESAAVTLTRTAPDPRAVTTTIRRLQTLRQTIVLDSLDHAADPDECAEGSEGSWSRLQGSAIRTLSDLTRLSSLSGADRDIEPDDLRDGWGTAFRFISTRGCNNSFVLWSAGPNGTFDSDDPRAAGPSSAGDDILVVSENGAERWVNRATER